MGQPAYNLAEQHSQASFNQPQGEGVAPLAADDIEMQHVQQPVGQYPTLSPPEFSHHNKVLTEQQARENIENALDVPASFTVQRDKQRYIIKVYSLLSIMMAVSAGWCIHVYNRERVERWYDRNMWSAWVSGLGILLLSLSFIFCFKVARKPPVRMLVFLLFAFGHVVFFGSFVEIIRKEEDTEEIASFLLSLKHRSVTPEPSLDDSNSLSDQYQVFSYPSPQPTSSADQP